MPHPNKRIGVCDRCDDDAQLFLEDIHNNELFEIVNDTRASPRGPFNRRALFCKRCIGWATSIKDSNEYRRQQKNAKPNDECTSSTSTADLVPVEDDHRYLSTTPVSQPPDTYQMTITRQTGLDSLNLRTVTITTLNTNRNTTSTNSPVGSDIQTAPVYEDISDGSNDLNIDMLSKSISDPKKFTKMVLNSNVDPMLTPTEEEEEEEEEGVNMLDPLDLVNRIQPLLTIEPVYPQEDSFGVLDPQELNQYIDPIQSLEPPDEFADIPTEPAEQPIIEQASGVQRIQRIQRDDSDDPLDDNVPGEYFDC